MQPKRVSLGGLFGVVGLVYIYIHPRGAYGPINNLLEVKDVSKNHLLEGAGT